MLVSVIVPAYNEENYIRPCLESLAHQPRDGFDFEIILVDANRTDRTREIAQEYGVHIFSKLSHSFDLAHEHSSEREINHGD